MKKSIPSLAILVIVMLFTAGCYSTGDKEDQAGVYHFRCKFSKLESIDYSVSLGIAVAGVTYQHEKIKAKSLWMSPELFRSLKFAEIHDSISIREYNCRCWTPNGFSNEAIVIYVER